MILEVAARAPVGLLPVVAFLAALMYFDSYKLVGLRIVVATIFVGAAAAGLCYVINDAALREAERRARASGEAGPAWGA